MSETRKLAAIVAADVAGYSRLTAGDEERTVARLRGLRTDLIDPAISVHRGRVVKRTGDGILIEFRSVVDAVRCSIEIQDGMAERNAGVAPERQIWFRCGIHLGDVIEESDGDLMGDGVNIAARLENMCAPGAICLSEQAYWQVKSRLDLAVSDLGDQALKNIPEPVHVYSLEVGKPATAIAVAAPEKAGAQGHAKAGSRPQNTITTPTKVGAHSSTRESSGSMDPGFRRGGRGALISGIAAAAAALIVIAGGAGWYFLGGQKTVPVQTVAAPVESAKPAAAPPAPPAHLSIVVLPFANLSGDEKQDYFADGITENLTTDLSRIRNSFVIARNTAFTFKGKNVDAKEIGKELGVRYVLEGSVQRDGDRVRVNAQLIDAESGAHLWADRFEDDLADLFKLQDDVVARLANTLGYELVKAEAAKSAHATNPDAIDLTMQGWAIANRWDTAGDRSSGSIASDLFKKALKIDPANVEAKVGLAQADYYSAAYVHMDREAEFTAKAEQALTEAITLDPDNARAYVVRQLFYTFTHRSAEAKAAARKAISLNPNYAAAYAGLAQAEHEPDEFEDSLSNVNQAIKLSPRDPAIGRWYWIKGKTFNFMRRFPEAIREFQKAIDNGFSGWPVYMHLAVAYALDGQQANARSAVEQALKTNPKMTVKWAQEHVDDPEVIWEGMRKAGVPEDDAPRLSIVVLPFSNLSGDDKQDYLADVLTDELTTYISRIPDSFVIARNTAFTYKGKPTDVKQIGKDLGVRYALEGSVQPTATRIRTNAQLIDTETGAHLWAEEFDTDKTDLLETEDEIVTRLARTLQVQLAQVEAARRARDQMNNPTAQDLALHCRANVDAITLTMGNRRPDYGPCEQALALDKGNALASTTLATRDAMSVMFGLSTDAAGDLKRADELASSVLSADPEAGGAHTVKGLVYLLRSHADLALPELERAIALNPSDMGSYIFLCVAYDTLDRAKDAVDTADQFLRLSPRDPLLANILSCKGRSLFILRQYDRAIVELPRAIAVTPEYFQPYFFYIAALALTGNTTQARDILRDYLSFGAAKIRTVRQFKTVWDALSSYPEWLDAMNRAADGLRKAGMPEE